MICLPGLSFSDTMFDAFCDPSCGILGCIGRMGSVSPVYWIIVIIKYLQLDAYTDILSFSMVFYL